MENKQSGSHRITIGDAAISYTPETKKALDLELLLLNCLLFTLVFAFALDYVSLPLFLLMFYAVAMRIFIGNHDRFHADYSVRFPHLLEAFAEGLFVIVTPWDEPYDSIRRKHLAHHGTHTPGKSARFDTAHDPHSAFELGGLVTAFFSSLFYEEAQLYFDIRDGNLTRSRLYRFLVATPLIAAFIFAFGWTKFLFVFLALRIVGFTVWFVFSWVLHQPSVYQFGFHRLVPKPAKWLFALIHGRRITEGCIHHATHHAWPAIPYDQLHKFDVVVLAAPDAAPDLRPAGM